VRATVDTIWQIPVYLPYLQPPLTDDAVAAAEKVIGRRLPSEYLDLLRKQNGGYIRFSLPEMGHDKIAGIGPNFPSLTGFDWDECQGQVSYPLRGLVPFDGDGHWHLCLDYRKDARVPAVTFANVECDSETPLADSFADYLAMLRPKVDDEHVLQSVPDLERLKADLSRRLAAAFDSLDDYTAGYPIERARLGDDRNPQWLWISPNTVRRGFIRPDESGYSVLKDLLPGLGDRFPGLPAGSYILSATDGVRDRVLDACGATGLTIRPLRDYLGV